MRSIELKPHVPQTGAMFEKAFLRCSAFGVRVFSLSRYSCTGQLVCRSGRIMAQPRWSIRLKEAAGNPEKIRMDRQSRLAGRDKLGRFEELDKAREKKSSTVEHLPLPGYGDVDR